MAHESIVVAPVLHVTEVPGQLVQDAALAPTACMPTPTVAQTQAADQVFSHSQQESQLVSGLFGMWTGVLLLHDLAVEHFDRPDEEEDGSPKLKRPKPNS